MNNNKNNRSKTIESIMFLCLLVVAAACSWFVAIYDGILLVQGVYTINNIIDVIGFCMVVMGPIALTVWTFIEANSIEKSSSQKEEA